jgi:hypothetical protein
LQQALFTLNLGIFRLLASALSPPRGERENTAVLVLVFWPSLTLAAGGGKFKHD